MGAAEAPEVEEVAEQAARRETLAPRETPARPEVVAPPAARVLQVRLVRQERAAVAAAG
jgi:hypothetical protein